MNHLSLFSGIGGIDLAAEWAGMKTVAFVEKDKFCQKVLAKHWPNVPIFGDIKTISSKDIHEPIDIISGGFPCQPWSNAGKQLGTEDDRHLWPEFSRVIGEFRPDWVVAENVTGLISRGLDQVLSDMEAQGYATRVFVFPACAVEADHERYRVFIIAHAKCKRQSRPREFKPSINPAPHKTGEASRFVHAFRENSLPYLCREHDGIPQGLAKDGLTALGNAVMPQQIYPIMKAIKDIEEMMA